MGGYITVRSIEPVWLRVLKYLRGKRRQYIWGIVRDLGVTYTSTVRIINELIDLGLIQYEFKKKKKWLQLTDRGEDIAQAYATLHEKVTETLIKE